MEKLLLTLCLLLFYFFSFAKGQYNTDSLWAIWNNRNLPDTQRFDAMIELSWAQIMYYRLDSAFTLIEQLMEETRPKGYKKYECVYQFGLGLKRQQTGQYDESEVHFKKSIALAEKYHMPKIKNWSLMGLADTYGLQGKYDESIEWYTRSLQFADSIGNIELKDLSIGNRGIIYNKKGDRQKALADYLWALEITRQHYFPMAEAGLQVLLGNYYRDHDNNYPKALEYYLKGEALAREVGYDILLAEILMAIGRLHDQQEDYQKGLEYKLQTLAIWKAQENKNAVMWTYNNLAYSYFYMKDWEPASKYFELNLQLAEEMKSALGRNYAYFGLGEVAYEQEQYKKALEFFTQSLEAAEETSISSRIANSYQAIGKSYEGLGQSRTAINWCKKGYDYFKNTNVFNKIKQTCQCLYQAHKSLNQPGPALFYFEQIAEMNDSLNVQEIGKKMLQMEFSRQMLADSLADVEEALRVDMAHAAEISKKNHTRNILIGSGLLALLLAGALWNRLRYTRKSRAAIQKEKDRSENLLLNILPAEVAEELKMNGKAAARHYDMVSILFTDFKNFTQLSEKMSAGELVEEINVCFKAFDTIVEKYQIEKIKTIGDAYMAAGGLPIPSRDAAKNTVLAALEMQAFISERTAQQEDAGKISFEMRVGIHTGPVVAGIVGIKKFQYDLWGDTVNTASRMENNGAPGLVNISRSTYELIQDDPMFSFRKREAVSVKGKGKMDMYFVLKKRLLWPETTR